MNNFRVNIDSAGNHTGCGHPSLKGYQISNLCTRCNSIRIFMIDAELSNPELEEHLKAYMYSTPSGKARQKHAFMTELWRLAPEEFPMIAAANISRYSIMAAKMLEGNGKIKKELSIAAQCANHAKATVEKKFGIKVRARSDSFSGGNSVTVVVPRKVSETIFAEIAAFVKTYQYGEWDGMVDSYNYNNKIEGLPQAMYVGTQYSHKD